MKLAQWIALLWLAALTLGEEQPLIRLRHLLPSPRGEGSQSALPLESLRRETTVIPWAWERREDLRFMGAGATVAWYAGIITLDGERVQVEPRRNPLQLADKVHRVAVIRIETKQPALDDAQLRATLAAIRRLYRNGTERNAEELQIDFDATRSERAFYRELLVALKKEIDAPLSITALASWCLGDRWMSGLPIDEAVPMLFRMGRDEREVHARLARKEPFPEPRCRASAGISLDEPLPRIPKTTRLWVFNPERWTEAEWNTALSRAR